MEIAPRLAVSACLFDAPGRVLLVRRANPPYAGHWTLPGGRVRWGESLVAAIAREVHEETRLNARKLALLTPHEVMGDDHHVVILVFRGEAEGSPCPGDDAADARFCTPAELVALAATDGVTPGLAQIVTMARQKPGPEGASLAPAVR